MAEKERHLKKYEAAAAPCAIDEAPPAMDFFSPFGPMIAKTRLPPSVLGRVNAHVDQLAEPGIGKELVLPAALLAEGGEDSLLQHAERAIRRYLSGLENTTPDSIGFETFWVVSQFAGTPSPVHFHSADIAGIAYLKVPEIDAREEAKTYISGRHAGYVNFMIGGKQRFSKSIISFRPQVGDFYLFPGWLLHGAEPFRGQGERRSMSFNAVVAGGG